MNRFLQNGTAAVVFCGALWIVDGARSQVPQRIPTGDQERLVNLELRVAHLEQALAQLQTKNSSSTVKAPFKVVNAAGTAILNVTDEPAGGALSLNDKTGGAVAVLDTSKIMLHVRKGYAGIGLSSEDIPLLVVGGPQHASLGIDPNTGAMGLRLAVKTGKPDVTLDLEGGVGNLHLFKGNDQIGSLSTNPGGAGARLQLNDTSGSAAFTAGISSSGDGFVQASSRKGAGASLGADSDGNVGMRVYSVVGGGPSGGTALEPDGSAIVYAGTPGNARVKMFVDAGGHGNVSIQNQQNQPVVWMQSTDNGGGMAATYGNGKLGMVMETAPDGNGGHGVFYDAGGKAVLTLTAVGPNRGDVCIVRGDKPGKCLAETVLPLSIGQ